MKLRSLSLVKKILIWKKSFKWTSLYLKRSGVFVKEYRKDVVTARIRKEAHTIEKGLSLPNIRPFFGQNKIKTLFDDIDLLAGKKDAPTEVDKAIDVLKSYLTWHSSHNHRNAFIDGLEKKIKDADFKGSGGTISYRTEISDEEREIFNRLTVSRRSVRNFAPRKIPTDVLNQAIQTAWSAPSVCNRQPWAVAAVQSDSMLAKMLARQAGNNGFREVIPTLLVILADLDAFVEDYEVFEPFVDAGIFSGFVVNALHSHNVGSCCLNLCVSQEKAQDIIKQLGVGDRFFPIMMIACGYPADHCQVAMSARGLPVVFER